MWMDAYFSGRFYNLLGSLKTARINADVGYVCMLSHVSRVWLFATPWTVARQVPLSWDFPNKNAGVGCHFLLLGIFPTQGSNLHLPCFLHCRRILYHWGSLTLVGVEEKKESDLLWDIWDLRLHSCNRISRLEISSFFENFSMFSMENDGRGIRGHFDKYLRTDSPRVFYWSSRQWLLYMYLKYKIFKTKCLEECILEGSA